MKIKNILKKCWKFLLLLASLFFIGKLRKKIDNKIIELEFESKALEKEINKSKKDTEKITSSRNEEKDEFDNEIYKLDQQIDELKKSIEIQSNKNKKQKDKLEQLKKAYDEKKSITEVDKGEN